MNYELIKNNVRVCLDDECGEGWNGDYNPDDSDDQMLLRFSVDVRDGETWVGVDSASYCTQLPNTISSEQARVFLDVIMREVYDALQSEASIKRTCERLSWTKPEDLASHGKA